MDRMELVERFRKWLSNPRVNTRGEATLARYLFLFFDTKVKESYQYTGILLHIPRHLVEATQIFRSSQEEEIVALRYLFLQETEWEEIPDLTEMSFGGLERLMFVRKLAELMTKVTGELWLEGKVEDYLFAQDNVLDQKVQRFARQVYREGMWQMNHDCLTKGMSGQFGTTMLRSFEIAGRFMITFARKSDGSWNDEESLTVITSDDDPTGIHLGVQSCHASLQAGISMIDEIIALWPQTLEERQKVYFSDEKVSII